MWEQRAHGAVLFWARRHCTRFALHWLQADRLTAGFNMLVSIREGSRWAMGRARIELEPEVFLHRDTPETECNTAELRLRRRLSLIHI